jgi:hypothetical protein
MVVKVKRSPVRAIAQGGFPLIPSHSRFRGIARFRRKIHPPRA